MPRVSRPKPRFLDDVQVVQALQLARQHGIYSEVATAIYTGLRLSELRALKWENVDFAAREILIEDQKADKMKRVPLNAVALQALADRKAQDGKYEWVWPGVRKYQVSSEKNPGGWNPHRPRRLNTWMSLLKPLQEAMPIFRELPPGTVGRGWHLLRHTFASHLVQNNVSILKVSRWLGHSSVVTTEKYYAHLKPGYDPEIERI